MLRHNIPLFLDYCKTCNFSERSLEALTGRLDEFSTFLNSHQLTSISQINYNILIQVVADFGNPRVQFRKIGKKVL